LQTAFTSTFDFKTFYFRFKEGLGHVVIERTACKDTTVFEKGFTAEQNQFSVKVAEGADLKAFYSEHGDHYNMCVKNLLKSKQDAVN